MAISRIGMVLGPLLFILIKLFFAPEGLSEDGVSILACTVWIAIWWITEAIPIEMTALLPLVLFPITGGLSINETSSSYGHKYVFLYAGGFIIAIAIERWNLHKRIALTVINMLGTSVKMIILGFMIATAFLSMWISNTATSVMMLPIGMAIVLQLNDDPRTEQNENLIFGKALMLAIAYSASIGGIGTLIGTPPNLILAGVVEELYGVELSFARWFAFGFPIAVVMLFICWKYLTTYAFKFKQEAFPGGRAEIRKRLKDLGKVSYEEKCVLVVFILTAIAWISRSFLLGKIIPGIDDTIIAIAAAFILFLIPARQDEPRMLLTWNEAVKLPWGILLLFGGGLALAEGFKTTGLAEWIGSQMSLLEGAVLILVLLIIVASVNFLTEITSNLATTAMILPILAPLAMTIDIHPYLLMVGATVAASCAFMLPVATPPNAVVFGSGYLRIPDMVRVGIWMNIISIILLTIAVYLLMPLVWGIDVGVYPINWK